MEAAIGLSLIAFPEPEEFRAFYHWIADKRIFRNLSLPGFDAEPVFELSYAMDEKYLEAVSRESARIVSVHAPCPHTEILPNLGSEDSEVVDESLAVIRASAGTASRFGADILVIHAGYATNRRMYTVYERRREVLETENWNSSYIMEPEGMICSPGYCESPGYRRHLERVILNLPRAIGECRKLGVTLAVENINLRITYLPQRPEDMLYISDRVPDVSFCLDFGHLWLSSLVHRFDFLEAAEHIIGTGRVITTHIHNNHSRIQSDPVYSDDHLGVENGNLPFHWIPELLRRGGVKRWIIESGDDPLGSLRFLYQSLSQGL